MALVQVILVVGVLMMETSHGQDYGPVNLDTVDPLSLSWNQIHSLVKDQIKEVEGGLELKKLQLLAETGELSSSDEKR